jgi:hypothetical protein
MEPIHVQMGLFGGDSEIAGFHVVTAHTRVLADGSEVFVGEHLRWNRGRTPERTSPEGGADESVDQLALFPR